MRMTAALYIKELKDVRGVFCLLAIGTVVLQGWVLLTIETLAIALFFASLPVWATLFVMPFLLASSFNGEWRANTNQLLFALPVRTGIVGLCKFSAILSAGLVLFGIAGRGPVFRCVARATGNRFRHIGNCRRRADGGLRLRGGGFRVLSAVVAWHRDSHGGREVHGGAPAWSHGGRFICLMRCRLSDAGGLFRGRLAGIPANRRGVDGVYDPCGPGLLAGRTVPV